MVLIPSVVSGKTLSPTSTQQNVKTLHFNAVRDKVLYGGNAKGKNKTFVFGNWAFPFKIPLFLKRKEKRAPNGGN